MREKYFQNVEISLANAHWSAMLPKNIATTEEDQPNFLFVLSCFQVPLSSVGELGGEQNYSRLLLSRLEEKFHCEICRKIRRVNFYWNSFLCDILEKFFNSFIWNCYIDSFSRRCDVPELFGSNIHKTQVKRKTVVIFI